MTSGNESSAEVLRSLYAFQGPFASVYIRLQARPELELDNEERWRELLRRLVRRRDGRRELVALTNEFQSRRFEAGRLVMIAADGDVRLSAVLPETGGDEEDQALWGSLPHLVPLLAWRQEHPAHVVAVVDRTGADLQVYAAGATEARRVRVEGPDDEIERNQPGGMAQMRYQHRAEDSWEHNAVVTARAVDDALRQVDAHVLMLAGDVRARQYFLKHLPTRVRWQVTVRPVSGSRSADGAWSERARQVQEAVLQAGHAETDAFVSEFAEQRSPTGTAVEGAYATLRALAAGRLRTLLVCDDSGARRTAWFGPGPTDVTPSRGGLPEVGGSLVRGPLVDVAVRGAMLTGARIRVVEPGLNAGPSQGIGGVCRYATPVAA
jgi:hypothetical protein